MRVTRSTSFRDQPPYNALFQPLAGIVDAVFQERLSVNAPGIDFDTYETMPWIEEPIIEYANSRASELAVIEGDTGIGKTSVLQHISQQVWKAPGQVCRVLYRDLSGMTYTARISGEEFFHLPLAMQEARAKDVADEIINSMLKEELSKDTFFGTAIESDQPGVRRFVETYFPAHLPNEYFMGKFKDDETVETLSRNDFALFMRICFCYLLWTQGVYHVKVIIDNTDDKDGMLIWELVQNLAHLQRSIQHFSERERNLDPSTDIRFVSQFIACRPPTSALIHHKTQTTPGGGWNGLKVLAISRPAPLHPIIARRLDKYTSFLRNGTVKTSAVATSEVHRLCEYIASEAVPKQKLSTLCKAINKLLFGSTTEITPESIDSSHDKLAASIKAVYPNDSVRRFVGALNKAMGDDTFSLPTSYNISLPVPDEILFLVGERTWSLKKWEGFYKRMFYLFDKSRQAEEVQKLCNYNVAQSIAASYDVMRNRHFVDVGGLFALTKATKEPLDENSQEMRRVFTTTAVLQALAYGNQGDATQPQYPFDKAKVPNILWSSNESVHLTTLKPRIIQLFVNKVTSKTHSLNTAMFGFTDIVTIFSQCMGVNAPDVKDVIDEMYFDGLLSNVNRTAVPSKCGDSCELHLTNRAYLLWNHLQSDSVLVECYRDAIELDVNLERNGEKAEFTNAPTRAIYDINERARQVYWVVVQFWQCEKRENDDMIRRDQFKRVRTACGDTPISWGLCDGLDSSRVRYYERNRDWEFVELGDRIADLRDEIRRCMSFWNSGNLASE